MPAPPEITSTKNPLIKRIRALADREAREAEGRLAVEGPRMIEEVLAAGIPVDLLLYDPAAATGRAAAVLARARQDGVRLVSASSRVIAACSQVEAPQGMIAVVHRPHASLDAVLDRPDLLLVVADRVQDPGNLGTIVRIADAAGASAVLVTRGSADPFNPKALRATMGSVFHLPVAAVETPQAIAALQHRGVRLLVADQRGAVDYAGADYHPPVAVVLGGEAEGPDAPWRAAADATVRIPLYGHAESLNVAIAAGLLLYEARRAWTRGGGNQGAWEPGNRKTDA